jgi:hypothetical protein
MAYYGHDTDLMSEWSRNLTDNNQSYRELVDSLYDIFARFYNSPEFSGGLSEQLNDQSGEQRQHFLDFETTFEECAKFVTERAETINDETARLSSMAANENPMG